MPNEIEGHEDAFLMAATPEPRIRILLEYAVRAPSTHNTQPWQFRIGTDSVDIIPDVRLQLPKADPLGRDLFISIGCCVENLSIAAKRFRVFAGATTENGEGRPFVRVRFTHDVLPKEGTDAPHMEELAQAVLLRRNTRGRFEKTPLDPEARKRLSRVEPEGETDVVFIEDGNAIRRIAELTEAGFRLAHADVAFRKELAGWMHSSFTKKRDGMPGYSMRIPKLISLVLPMMLKRRDLSDKLAPINRESVASAPLICVLGSHEENPAGWVDVGRTAERLMLESWAAGLKTSIFVASVEMGDFRHEVQQIADLAAPPQFLFCIGKLDSPQGLTPRRTVEEKMLRT